MRSTRKRLSAAAPTARSTSPSRLSRARGSTLTFLARLICSEKASDDGSARAAYDLAALVSNGVGGKPPGEALALFRRAAAQGYPEGYRAAAVLLDEGRGVAKNPSAAADDLLRAVATDAGEARAELTGKTQIWTAETVRQLQARLKSAGYYGGPIDGRTGAALGPALTQWRLLGGAPRI